MSSGCATVRGDQLRANFEFRHLLVLSDFSRGAKSALNCAQAIARKFKSKIFLLHLIPSEVFQFVSSDSCAEALLRAKEFAEQRMNVLLDEVKPLGLVEAGIVVEGQLLPRISEVVKSQQIDLIAVGTHSGSSEKKLALGSVAEQIYRMADCPILTSPPEFSSDCKVDIQRILFTTDFKPHNQRAALIAHSLGCGPHQRLTFLHVVEEPSGTSVQSNKIIKEFLMKRLAKSLPISCVEQCSPAYEVRFGKPIEEILSASRQLNSDLITIGVRATHKAVGHLPSPLAYSVVCRAECPVLTIQQK